MTLCVYAWTRSCSAHSTRDHWGLPWVWASRTLSHGFVDSGDVGLELVPAGGEVEVRDQADGLVEPSRESCRLFVGGVVG